MQIWVDADACPVVIKQIIFRAAERGQVHVTLVANKLITVVLPVTPDIGVGPGDGERWQRARGSIAALLHDAIEDRGNAYESPFQVEPRTGREALKRDIELQFGTDVLSIVRQCTDDEYLPAGRASEKGSPEESKVRKTAYLASLRKKTDVAPLRVSCADKLQNARAILGDYETEGERLWQRFNVKSKAGQLWYYKGLADAFTERSLVLGDAALQRLARQLNQAQPVETVDPWLKRHARHVRPKTI